MAVGKKIPKLEFKEVGSQMHGGSHHFHQSAPTLYVDLYQDCCREKKETRPQMDAIVAKLAGQKKLLGQGAEGPRPQDGQYMPEVPTALK